MKDCKKMAEEIFEEIERVKVKRKKVRKNILRAGLCALIALVFLPGAVYFTTGENLKDHIPLSFDWSIFDKEKKDEDSSNDDVAYIEQDGVQIEI